MEAAMQSLPLHDGRAVLGTTQSVIGRQQLGLPLLIAVPNGQLQRPSLKLSTHLGDVGQLLHRQLQDSKASLVLLTQQAIGRQTIEGLTQRAQPYLVGVPQQRDREALASAEAPIEQVLSQGLIDAAGRGGAARLGNVGHGVTPFLFGTWYTLLDGCAAQS